MSVHESRRSDFGVNSAWLFNGTDSDSAAKKHIQ